MDTNIIRISFSCCTRPMCSPTTRIPLSLRATESQTEAAVAGMLQAGGSHNRSRPARAARSAWLCTATGTKATRHIDAPAPSSGAAARRPLLSGPELRPCSGPDRRESPVLTPSSVRHQGHCALASRWSLLGRRASRARARRAPTPAQHGPLTH